ncbi:endonuclease/exonuclease/phosphatase family protein [uncultured Arthrobacter sp.]|uniref:endonuclease/exonuclease/phosphatase family protein n=1 Tax=uncultured Arthrobacter sp. TaxID=114050 RepID=UPI00260EB82D|nr:endonuclease/exonuclease/phosphatase family protein [uncultured Arthrobacter sp.]
MRVLTRCTAALLAALLLLGVAPAAMADHGDEKRALIASRAQASGQNARFATFTTGLTRPGAGELVQELSGSDSAQARATAEILQTARPDVVLLGGFDNEPGSAAVELFYRNYLRVGQNGKDPLDYPYVYAPSSNAGVPSGFDLDNDGSIDGPGDALGPGAFRGQDSMVLFSRYPIQADGVRTFRNFLWKDMPGALLDSATTQDGAWYSADELAVLPLSSTSHWDVPVVVAGRTVHVLASHPGGPVTEGSDGAGARTGDEVRFWSDYVRGASYGYDDDGTRGGLRQGERFVVMGDQNIDPFDGGAASTSIDRLLDSSLVQDPLPSSEGAVEAAALQGGANATHRGDPRFDTVDLEDQGAGNLRADYVLPSRTLRISSSGVLWPRAGLPGSELTGIAPFPASGHRLVYADVVPRDTRSR